MRFGIIGAMEEEIDYVLQQMTDYQKFEVANSVFYDGKIANQDVVLLQSGIGKVNAAMATTILIERFQPTVVINTGSAGGFDKELQVGDIVISREVVHHDVDVTGFNYEVGQVPGMPVTYQAATPLVKQVQQILDNNHVHSKIGLIGTGDIFMNNPERIHSVLKQFPNMLAAEMEGAAIAQVCHQYKVPFVIIRALSDIAGVESSISFNEFLTVAAKNAAHLIIDLVKEGLHHDES